MTIFQTAFRRFCRVKITFFDLFSTTCNVGNVYAAMTVDQSEQAESNTPPARARATGTLRKAFDQGVRKTFRPGDSIEDVVALLKV